MRPQYFLYWMLGQLGGERLAARAGPAGGNVPGDATDGADSATGATELGESLRVVAAASGTGARALLVNYRPEAGRDLRLELQLTNLRAGMKRLSIYRIDAARRWRGTDMVPMAVRETPDPEGRQEVRLRLPADTVALACLDQVQRRA